MTKTKQLRKEINHQIATAQKKGVTLTSICEESKIQFATFQRIRKGENTTTNKLDAIERAIKKLTRGK